ncbi:uncharacterized protein [Leuresthes tenuis]|uniref:uncharacterized protein n=1 Tax=Leuresthes tenuis TaxID=355514 RepID=UPI003B51503F
MEAACLDSRRTVVVSGVPNVLSVSRMIDKLTIHFQSSRRSGGGDVEVVKYPSNMDGVAFVTFDKAQDAERVVRKEQQIMGDDEFPEDYRLTVFPFSRDVFFYVPSATLDLSAFGTNQASLIESLQSAHRSIRFRSLPEQKVSIEGPFSAVKSLRQDLIQRASRLKLSAQSPSITHLGSVGSARCSSSKVQQEPASSSGLSASQQSTGEPREVQSLLWEAKTQKDCLRRHFSDESFAGGSFLDTGSIEEEEEPKAQSRREVSTKYRTERTQTNLRHVVGEEVSAGILPSFSGLKLPPAGEISAKQQREDGFLEKHSRMSAAKGETHSGTDDPKNWSSFSSEFPQTGLGDASAFSESWTKDSDSEDTWADLYTFRYIEKLDKNELDKCLKGVDMSAECVKGSGLVRISLTEKQPRKAGSRILEVALEDLKTLMEFWQSILRVHEIFYNKAEWPDKQKLSQICDQENSLFLNVLYVLEDSCIKVIGPSLDSHLFYSRVEDKMMKLKDFRVNSRESSRRLKEKLFYQ